MTQFFHDFTMPSTLKNLLSNVHLKLGKGIQNAVLEN